MNNPEIITALPVVSNQKMLTAMAGIGIICAFLIVLTYEGTAATIEKNKARALEKAIYKVIPEIAVIEVFQLNSDGTLSKSAGSDSKTKKVYAGYNKTGDLKGIAIQGNGKGYGDVLNLLYGYDPVNQKIIGFNVLESKETPGIGDKIEKGTFPDNFKAMDVSLNDKKDKLNNNINTVKNGEKKQSYEIDGITGATVTSRAVGNILNTSANEWMPVIQKNIDSFTGTIKKQ
jgi:electron transport complex protein RnfG